MEDSILAQAKHDAVLIGEHFSAWRRLNGLKLVDLAERSGVSVNTIHDLENGKGGTGLIAVLAIARVLGVDNLRPDDPDEPPHYKSERMLLLETLELEIGERDSKIRDLEIETLEASIKAHNAFLGESDDKD